MSTHNIIFMENKKNISTFQVEKMPYLEQWPHVLKIVDNDVKLQTTI